MKFGRLVLLVSIGIVFTVSAIAQSTPRELRDLVGGRASTGESELQKRGYTWVKTTEGSDRKWSNWWNDSRRQCITVATVNGRYDSIVTSPQFDCNRNNNNNNNNGNWGQTRPPSWAQGTWYGNGPNGERIMLSIANNGNVTANVDGSNNSGYFGGGNTITINGVTSNVSREGNGIKTVRRDNGEQIFYSKSNWNNNNNNNNNNGNWGQVRPSNWARGTWYGTGPNGEKIVLTINDNGSVSASVNGSMSYGTYGQRDTITINGATSNVIRDGSSIQTVRRDNGEGIYYSRSNYGGGNNNNNYNNKVDLTDLIGARASSGESEMKNRGFRIVDSFSSGNSGRGSVWWRSQSRQCIQIITVDGRYDSINDIGTHPKCR